MTEISKHQAHNAAVVASSLLNQHWDALHAIKSQFEVMVEWTNSQGFVRDSATLYKLIQDTDYLLQIGPRLVRNLITDTDEDGFEGYANGHSPITYTGNA